MRIDPITRKLLSSGGNALPGPVVLLYHATPIAGAGDQYAVLRRDLEAQIDLLRDLGYRFGLVRELATTPAPPTNTVYLTFDDGMADNYDGAFSPLVRRSVRATWFVVTDRLGGIANWTGSTAGSGALLDAPRLREMLAAGMEIGSHSRSHPDLTSVNDAALYREVAHSRSELGRVLDTEITSFAYPYGLIDDRVRHAVAAAGYSCACSTRCGSMRHDHDLYAIRRITVFRSDSLSVFARKLVFASNDAGWLAVARYALERAIARLGGVSPAAPAR